MAKKKTEVPKYGTITLKGIQYYRTRIMDAVWQWAEFKVVLFEDLVLNLQGSSCRKELSLKVSWQPQGAEGQH